jgi:hypothetical protein
MILTETLRFGLRPALLAAAVGAAAAAVAPLGLALAAAAAPWGARGLAAVAVAGFASVWTGPWLAAAALGAAATADPDATDPLRRATAGALAGFAAVYAAASVAAALPAAVWGPAVAAATALTAGLIGAWLAVDPDPPPAWAGAGLPGDDRRAANQARELLTGLAAPAALRRPLHRLAAAVIRLSHRRVALRVELRRLESAGAESAWGARVQTEHDHVVNQRAEALRTLAEARAALSAVGDVATADAPATWRKVHAVASEAWARRDADRQVDAL